MTKAESKVALGIGLVLLGIPALVAPLFARGTEGGLLILLAVVFTVPFGLILIVVAGVQLLLIRYPKWVAAVRERVVTDWNQADAAHEQIRDFFSRLFSRNEPEEDGRVIHLIEDRTVWDQIGRGLFPVHHDASERTIRIIWALFLILIVAPVALAFLYLSGSLERIGELLESFSAS